MRMRFRLTWTCRLRHGWVCCCPRLGSRHRVGHAKLPSSGETLFEPPIRRWKNDLDEQLCIMTIQRPTDTFPPPHSNPLLPICRTSSRQTPNRKPKIDRTCLHLHCLPSLTSSLAKFRASISPLHYTCRTPMPTALSPRNAA